MSDIDLQALRKALGNFLTGVTIVTTVDRQNTPRGFTANSFTSVSLNPPLILVCLAKSASSAEALVESSGFVVNILSESQRSLSTLFATKDVEKFSGDHWTRSLDGFPIIRGSLVVLHCSTYRVVDGGDHLIVMGEVKDFSVNGGHPLGFCRGSYVFPTLTHEAIELGGTALHVGGLLEWNNSLLLFGDEQGQLRFPEGASLGTAGNANSLIGSLAALGITASVNFLFGVFEDEKTHSHIIYRGNFVPGVNSPREAIFHFDDIPWASLSERNARMVRRFIDEKRRDLAGLYVGSHKAGAFYSLSGTRAWSPPSPPNSSQ